MLQDQASRWEGAAGAMEKFIIRGSSSGGSSGEDPSAISLPRPQAPAIRKLYVLHGKERMLLQDRLVASITAEVISLDHVNHPAKFVTAQGSRPFRWLLVVCNERGKIMAYWGTESAGISEVKHLLQRVHDRHSKLGVKVWPTACESENFIMCLNQFFL